MKPLMFTVTLLGPSPRMRGKLHAAFPRKVKILMHVLSKNTNGAEMSNPRGVVAFAETSLGGVRFRTPPLEGLYPGRSC